MDSFVKVGLLISACLSLYLIELFFDLRERREGRHLHISRNLILGIGGSVAVTFFYVSLLSVAELFAAQFDNIHLITSSGLPFLVQVVIFFLIFDGVLYLWHVANHKIPFLWRFHRVHHSDEDLDFSSGVRFHVGELALSTVVKAVLVIITGIPLFLIAIFDLMVTLFALFNHARISLGRSESILRYVIATPEMHRIHHSLHSHETNSNYTTMLSFWDRLCSTYTHQSQYQDGQGLKQYRDKKEHRLWSLLTMPFRK